jgi:hypothetical protein
MVRALVRSPRISSASARKVNTGREDRTRRAARASRPVLAQVDPKVVAAVEQRQPRLRR